MSAFPASNPLCSSTEALCISRIQFNFASSRKLARGARSRGYLLVLPRDARAGAPRPWTGRRLYRDSTLYKDGKHVRDLGKLNRDLSKVMLVTSDPDAFYINPENAIKVRPGCGHVRE